MADRTRQQTVNVYNKAGVVTGSTTQTVNYTVKRGTNDSKRPGYAKGSRKDIEGKKMKYDGLPNRAPRKGSQSRTETTVFPIPLDELPVKNFNKSK